ncbi:MAG: hypothetical protein U0271_33095 [Polyangiaceae bacterium]
MSGPPPLDLAVRDQPVPALPAATILLLRPPAEPSDELEIFCVQRRSSMRFLGGAVVFPGGKVDARDRVAAAAAKGTIARAELLADDAIEATAIAIAALRETFEEAGVLASPNADTEVSVRLRAAITAENPFDAELARTGLKLDLGRLVPFARWITPEAEARRYDTRFFLLECPASQVAHADERESSLGFWATPSAALERFAKGEIQLAPPTTRCFELLVGVGSIAAAVELARAQSLLPICPQFVPGDPPALALPGDPAHGVREPRVAGKTRFVLRDGRFVSEDP